VLLIDDDQLLSTAIARALHTAGYDVEMANDGKSGLAKFMAAERPFDVVVLDWLMPGISGEDVLAELRRLQPDLPIVLLSGFGMERTPSEDELVIRSMKPASLSELRAAIGKALDAGRRRARLKASAASRTHAG
jgi:DNA-binding response OmpR family regulator